MKILYFSLSVFLSYTLTIKVWFETQYDRDKTLNLSMDYLTPMKGDTSEFRMLKQFSFIPTEKLLEKEIKGGNDVGEGEIVFVEYTKEISITLYSHVFRQSYFSRKLVVLCEQEPPLADLEKQFQSRLEGHSKEIEFNPSSEWMYLNHAHFAFLEKEYCSEMVGKIFSNPKEIVTKELPSDLKILNEFSIVKDLQITLFGNLNVWKLIETLYETLKDYTSFTKYFKLNIEFPVVPQSEQPNGKSYADYYKKDQLFEHQVVNLDAVTGTGELYNFLVVRLNEDGDDVSASIYTDLMKLQSCYTGNNSVEFIFYLKLLLDIKDQCINIKPSNVTCIVDMVENDALKSCMKNMAGEMVRKKLYLNSASKSVGVDVAIQTSFYGYKINSNTNLDPDDNEFNSKKDSEIIQDICKMTLMPGDKQVPNICKYNYCTDGFKYSVILGKCVNIENVNQDKVLNMFNLLLLITIMALIVGVSFIVKKILKQKNRIGKINRSYSRLFGNKFDKIVETKSYIQE